MRSVRTRLLAYGALVVATTVALSLAILARGVGVEVSRQIETGDSAEIPIAPLRRAVAGPLLAEASDQGELQPLLARLSAERGVALLLVDGAGRPLAAAPPLASPAAVEILPQGGVRVSLRDPGGAVSDEVVLRGRDGEIRAPDGALRGVLIVLPPAAPPLAGGGLQVSLRRWYGLAAVIAVVVAVVLGALLARRLTRPIEALTAAARRLRAGRLGERVAIEGGDELGELASAFNAMAADLERAEAARQRLIADVAHELRSPLSRLRAQLEAMDDGLLPADRGALGVLQADVLLLSRLVADLQDLALADADRLRVLPVEVDSAAVVSAVVAAHQGAARQANVRLDLRSEPGVTLRGDPERLRQVLGNLLTNALAWTPPGGRVEVTAVASTDAVEWTVADSGPGVAPEHLERVFDRFYRADPSRVRDGKGGAGLGLAVARALARAHGGDIAVTGSPGGGGRFTVRLPRAERASQVPDNPPVPSS